MNSKPSHWLPLLIGSSISKIDCLLLNLFTSQLVHFQNCTLLNLSVHFSTCLSTSVLCCSIYFYLKSSLFYNKVQWVFILTILCPVANLPSRGSVFVTRRDASNVKIWHNFYITYSCSMVRKILITLESCPEGGFRSVASQVRLECWARGYRGWGRR